MSTVPLKRCSKCGEEKPSSDFDINDKATGAQRPDCKVCRRVYHRRWYAQNRERQAAKNREAGRRYREKNRDDINARRRDDYANNKSDIRGTKREWKARNRAKVNALAAKHLRANYLGVKYKNLRSRHKVLGFPMDVIISKKDFLELCKTHLHCQYCGVTLEHRPNKERQNPRCLSPDRLEPTVGYTKENIRMACWTCNRAKGTMSYEQFKMWAQGLAATLASR